jgi:hypothetical protein
MGGKDSAMAGHEISFFQNRDKDVDTLPVDDPEEVFDKAGLIQKGRGVNMPAGGMTGPE